MIDVIKDTLIDAAKMLPFLFLTYLAMEYLEHHAEGKAVNIIRRAGRFGPVLGAALGLVPQCGFSAAAANLYAGRVISLGTLVAVFLSTSDEMLPVLLSKAGTVPISQILIILAIKLVYGCVTGMLIDLIRKPRYDDKALGDICERSGCHCEGRGIVKSALIHTAQITAFIVIVTFALNLVMHYMNTNALAGLDYGRRWSGRLLAALIGLIPNCAASVTLVELWLAGAMSFGAMIAGLCSGAGIGLLALWRMNSDKKESFMITLLLLFAGATCGSIVDLVGVFAPLIR